MRLAFVATLNCVCKSRGFVLVNYMPKVIDKLCAKTNKFYVNINNRKGEINLF